MTTVEPCGWDSRPATTADLPWLFELHREALGPSVEATWGWDEDFQSAHFRDRFDVERDRILQLEGQDVGGLRCRTEEDALHLDYIAIAAAHRNRGLGERVVRDLMGRAETLGLPLLLGVLRANRAVGFYERLGFRRVKEDALRILMEWAPGKPKAKAEGGA